MKSCLHLVYAAVVISSLLVVRSAEAQPTSNADVLEQLHAMLSQAGGDRAATNLLLAELLRQNRLEQASHEAKQLQPESQTEAEARLEARAAGGAKRYQGSRRIGGTIILGR